MDRLGFIHEELDIKILILFILRRLPGVVDPTELSDLCRSCDDGFGYFDYTECLAELIENGLIAENEEGFSITEKGAKNVDLVETSIPYSVRTKAVKLLGDRMGVDMPITQAAYRVLYEGAPVGSALGSLMSRKKGREIEDAGWA